MDREGLDALVAVTANNVYYLSDFETDFLWDVPWVACAILPRRSDLPACLIVTEIEAAALVQRPTWMPNVRYYFLAVYGGILRVHSFAADNELNAEELAIKSIVEQANSSSYAGILPAVDAALRDLGLTQARLGFDDTRIVPALGNAIDASRVIDATNLFIEIRMVKTEQEILILREAARLNENAMRAAIGAIRDGATWGEVYTAYELKVVAQGARPFATFNGAGRQSAGAGRPDRSYRIQPGDHVCFDCMLKWRRYMGDAQRTIVLGEPSAKHRSYWKAFEAGIGVSYDRIAPGVGTGALRAQAVEAVRGAGIPNFQLAFTHGIGLDHIEVPFVAGGMLGDFPVEERMVLNIDIELHEVGWGGVFFEETMLVTARGAERLYQLPRSLICI